MLGFSWRLSFGLFRCQDVTCWLSIKWTVAEGSAYFTGVKRDILKGQSPRRQAKTMIRLTQGGRTTGYSDAFRSFSQFLTDVKAASKCTMTFSTTLICIIISSFTVKQARAFKRNGFVTLPTKYWCHNFCPSHSLPHSVIMLTPCIVQFTDRYSTNKIVNLLVL